MNHMPKSKDLPGMRAPYKPLKIKSKPLTLAKSNSSHALRLALGYSPCEYSR